VSYLSADLLPIVNRRTTSVSGTIHDVVAAGAPIILQVVLTEATG
jgi:hypothetical protein